MFQQQRADEFIVESFELVSHVVIAGFADNILHSGHQMINELRN